MPLSDAARDELLAELEYLETLRKQFNEKLNARAQVIRAVLEPFDMGQTTLPFPSVKSAGDTAPARDEMRVGMTGVGGIGAVGSVAGHKFASTGLRASILNVLKTRGPARAPNIASILAASGFENNSKTSLATRVYNDLWRMKEAGIVENRDGVFSLKEAA
jgi:hypothetical protein